MRGLPRRPIGDILISMGAISVEQLEEALLEQKQTHRKLGELLSAVGIVTEEQVTQARAIQMDVGYINYRAVGCNACGGTGYRGRTAIREIMLMNDDLRRFALAKANSSDIREAAILAGMDTMHVDGARKVLEGITTVDEVQRKIFIKVDFEAAPELESKATP